MTKTETLESVLTDVEAWYSEMGSGLDAAGATSAAMHFTEAQRYIERADDTATAAISALRGTRRYCASPRDKDLREKCSRFISRIRAAR